MMKKLICMAGAALSMLVSSCDGYDDTAIRDRVDRLNAEVELLEKTALELNDAILQVREFFLAAENGDVIKTLRPLEDGTGYVIEFAQAGEIVIRNGKDVEDEGWQDGEPGKTPVVGVERDEMSGRLCWTVNGEVIVDEEGNPAYLTVTADAGQDGTVPMLRVKDGMWQVSYNGNLWTDLAETSVQVPEGGMYWFTKVEQMPEYYVFTLRSSEEVKVSRLLPLNLTVLGYEDLEIVGGMTASVDYLLAGVTSRTKVYAVSNCSLEVSVQMGENGAGKIFFKAPTDLVDGSVLVYADNGYGSTSMRMFVFRAGRADVVDIEGYDPLEDFDWGINKE